MEDSQILELYCARDEQAMSETAIKYGGYLYSLANAILSSHEDTEEVLNDTYWKTWETIPPRLPTVFRMYLAKIARNLAFTRRRADTAQKRGGTEYDLVLDELESCIPAQGNIDDRLKLNELTKTIRSFLDAQSPVDQNIFLRRYFFVESVDCIAVRYGMKTGTVQRRLSRTRKKLKLYLTQEGYEV